MFIFTYTIIIKKQKNILIVYHITKAISIVYRKELIISIDYIHRRLLMSDIARLVGKRIRVVRNERKLSQEKLAELAGCHPTYIGQIERGEKNPTIESIYKIASALGISLSELFELTDGLGGRKGRNIPLECYELLSEKTKTEQEQILRIIMEMEKYKGNR